MADGRRPRRPKHDEYFWALLGLVVLFVLGVSACTYVNLTVMPAIP